MSAEQQLRELNIALPVVSAPAANYTDAVQQRGVHVRSLIGACSLRNDFPLVLKAVVEFAQARVELTD